MHRDSFMRDWMKFLTGVSAGAWLALGCVAPAAAVVAIPSTPFVAVTGGVWDGPGAAVEPEVTQFGAVGPLVVEVGSQPIAYGKFRSAFGSNGFEILVTGGNNRQVDGGSVWSDAFTVTGGTGSGTLLMSSRIDGTVSGAGEMAYALFVSSTPFDFAAIAASIQAADAFGLVQLLGATRVAYTAIANGCTGVSQPAECAVAPYKNFQGGFDATVSVSVPFTYDQTLYAVSLFAGGVGVQGGSASFLNSASFGISVPGGASLQTLSGTAYVAAVPEPATVLMLLAGLGLVCLRARSASLHVGG